MNANVSVAARGMIAVRVGELISETAGSEDRAQVKRVESKG